MIMTPVALLKLLKSKTPKQFYGDDVDNVYRQHAIFCHPDKFPGNDVAVEAFKKLGEMKEELLKPSVIIHSKTKEYAIERLYATGDNTDVHFAKHNGIEYLLKVTRDPKCGSLLRKEAEALKALEKLDEKPRLYFPRMIESFSIKGGQHVLVLAFDPFFHTLKQVKERFVDGVDAKHLAWMFKRLLAGIAHTHSLGLVHGHVTPEHFLVQRLNHGGRLLDWTMHVKMGEPLTSICSAYESFYPPEVFKKKPAGPGLDIYMAAKCGEYLLGTQDAPVQVRNFLKVCQKESVSMRPDDAWALHEEFSGILAKVYGPPKFHQLVLE